MADFKYEIIEHIGVISTSRKGWMKDVSWIYLGMYIAFVIGVFLWIIHGINIKVYNVISANSVTLVLASAILSYKIRYR
nr:hypothetical protein [Ligilactobacillus ruminis]